VRELLAALGKTDLLEGEECSIEKKQEKKKR